MVYLGLRPRVSYSAQRPTSAETGQILLLLLLVFPQALPGLEGGRQQTPFGRVALVGSMVASVSSPGGFASNRDVQDSVSIDIEDDFDLEEHLTG